MISKINTCSIVDSEAHLVVVETDVHNGLPDFRIVGATSSDVKDARERVRVGIENTGFILPPKRITVSLVPAPLKKCGTGFDLAIAVSVLSSFGFINNDNLNEYLVLGEVALTGELRPVNGTLFSILFGKSIGIDKFIVPADSLEECSYLRETEVYGFNNLYDLAVFLNGDTGACMRPGEKDFEAPVIRAFSEIKGEKAAKMAAVVSVSGGHTCMLTGGRGDRRKALILAASGLVPVDRTDIVRKAAYRGITEDIDFNDPATLGTEVYFFRDRKSYKEWYSLPGALQGNLIAVEDTAFDTDKKVDFYSFYRCRCKAENPKNCTCTPKQIRDNGIYLNKIKDEIADITVSLGDAEDIGDDELKRYADKAEAAQKARYKDTGISKNAYIPDKDIDKYCDPDLSARRYLKDFCSEYDLGDSEKNKLLRIARTSADMEGADSVTLSALKLAIALRGIYE